MLAREGEGVPWRDGVGEGAPFRECSFIFFKSYQKAAHPTLKKKKKASGEEPAPRRSASRPLPGLPPACPPPGSEIFAQSSPFSGSRARGGAEKRTQERFGDVMGLGLGGRGSFLATPSSPCLGAATLQPLAGSLAPFLYLGHSRDN